MMFIYDNIQRVMERTDEDKCRLIDHKNRALQKEGNFVSLELSSFIVLEKS